MARGTYESELRPPRRLLPCDNSAFTRRRGGVIGRHSAYRANIAFVDRDRAWSPAIRRSHWVKWAAFPCFVFWLILMTAIWFFLLGWARIVSATFSPTEIGMTVIVGLASLVGLAGAWRVKSSARVWPAVGTVLLVAALQAGAFRLNLRGERVRIYSKDILRSRVASTSLMHSVGNLSGFPRTCCPCSRRDAAHWCWMGSALLRTAVSPSKKWSSHLSGS
jgi:hypothetical protein